MKRRDEVNELRGQSENELSEKLSGLEEELMKLRFRHASGQLEQTAQLGALRKRVARIKTILAEKQLTAASAAPAE